MHFIFSRAEGVRGMVRIVLGVIFVIGGLSGRLALIGTNSGPALAVVGGVMIILGLVQLVRRRQ